MTASRTHRRFLSALALLGLCATPSLASVVHALPSDINARLVSFSSFDGAAFGAARVLGGAVEVGLAEAGESVLLSSDDNSVERILGPVAQTFGSNGHWPASGAYAGLNANRGHLLFSFSRGMEFVGGVINLDPSASDSTSVFEVLNAQGDVIEDAVLDFRRSATEPESGYGQFWGIRSAQSDIFALRLSANFVAIDDLRFGTAASGGALPEPGALGLVITSLSLLAVRRPRVGLAGSA